MFLFDIFDNHDCDIPKCLVLHVGFRLALFFIKVKVKGYGF